MLINARLPLPRGVRFSLRTILLIVMLTIITLPLLGLYFFRIYENELVRQTELELIAQSAVLSATWRQQLRGLNPDSSHYGYIINTSPFLPGQNRGYLEDTDPFLTPIQPTLDLVKPMHGPRPDARLTEQLPAAFVRQAGRNMQAILRDTQQVTLAGIRILDSHGIVVAGREETGMSLAHIGEVQSALRGHYASVIRQRISDEPPPPLYSISRGTNIRVFTAFPVMEGNRLQGVIYLSRTPKNILKHLYLVQDKLWLATLSLGLVALLLTVFVSSSISRPIRELILQTQRVARGEQTSVQPLQNPVTHEVAQLSESFASMSHALAERSDYISRFATHVSHEFKTPLTSMQGALELLQEHMDSMPEERRQRFLANLLNDTQRLKNLVSRLLELARADALEPSRQTTRLHPVLDSLHSRFRDRGLALDYTDLADHAVVMGVEALETILGNLFENSLQHQASCVHLRAMRRGQTLQLTLHDNGTGISAANRERIFTPFFTTRRNTGGTGLGLEITASLLRAHGGHICLGHSEQGACFILTLNAGFP